MTFNAAKARELAGKTVDEKVADLLLAIEEAAKNKKRSLKTSWEYKLDDDLWVRDGYSDTPQYKEAVNKLRDLGFTVTFYYRDGSMAVDMYTLIQW